MMGRRVSHDFMMMIGFLIHSERLAFCRFEYLVHCTPPPSLIILIPNINNIYKNTSSVFFHSGRYRSSLEESIDRYVIVANCLSCASCTYQL